MPIRRTEVSPPDPERGARIRAARKAKQLSQEQLAAEIGVSRVAVTQWEGGEMPEAWRWPRLAQSLGAGLDHLIRGIGGPPTNPIVGYVGAGAEVHPVDDYAKGAGIDEAPPFPGQDGPAVAVRVRGDSMLPMLEDGWLLYYSRDHDGVPEDCIGKLCVVQIEDGPTLVKTLERGRRRRHFRLVSHNASPREDVRLKWAARVRAIVP
ncbi:MAG: helix-turn-helix domain-containing protein [Azospirillum sp.]|nr:helix-turn-helix domain-containing protein [Azospirillum sp.]MCA3268473.1 helix-turn-helix domain-containing protein [Azospirillum sp.]